MEAFSFGSYYTGASALHRMDPRTKLLSGFAFLFAALLSRSFVALVILAIAVCAAFALSRIPVRYLLKSLAPLTVLVALVAILNLFTDQGGRVLVHAGLITISQGSLYSCVFTLCRMMLMMCAMSLVTLTTTTLDLTQAVERLLSPAAKFGLPAHELGMILGIALRFMPQFATELSQTYQAQVSRGASVSRGPLGSLRFLASVSVPMFASVFRHAETLSRAMDARCYHGEQGRTRLHPLHFTSLDGKAAAFMAVLVAAIAAVRILL